MRKFSEFESEASSASPDLSRVEHDRFGALVEPYRRELQVHCYRMLGAVQDAEDMVQETLLRAWRGRATFEGRASLRAWLYKIATYACLDALKQRSRRSIPRTRSAAATLAEPIPASIMEPIWLEPYPDEYLVSGEHSPEQYLSTRENIRLAFIAALHLLPPRQRAVLILRDVLDWQASEVAELMAMSVAAVKSALHRARSTLAVQATLPDNSEASPELTERLDAYMRAWEAADIPALIQLLTDDATFSMPPIPSWYRGRETIRDLTARTIFAGSAAGRWKLLPARANRQVAFGLYRLGETPGKYHAYGVQVLTLRDGLIADIITFRVPELVERFGLPAQMSNPVRSG